MNVDDAVNHVRCSLLDAEKVAKHTQEWVTVADRWLNLAHFLRAERLYPPEGSEADVRHLFAVDDDDFEGA